MHLQWIENSNIKVGLILRDSGKLRSKYQLLLFEEGLLIESAG